MEKQALMCHFLPENDELHIREQFFDQLQLDEFKCYDDSNVLMHLLDQHRVDLIDSLEKN